MELEDDKGGVETGGSSGEVAVLARNSVALEATGTYSPAVPESELKDLGPGLPEFFDRLKTTFPDLAVVEDHRSQFQQIYIQTLGDVNKSTRLMFEYVQKNCSDIESENRELIEALIQNLFHTVFDPLQRASADMIIGPKIHEGGTGQIRQATWRGNKDVVVKALIAEDAESQMRFFLEAEVLQALKGKFSPRWYTGGSVGKTQYSGETQYLVEELLHGWSLSDLLRQGALPPSVAFKIMALLTKNVCLMHAAGWIHRDLKPANVIITVKGEVKVIDFGLCKKVDTKHDKGIQDRTLTREGQIMGSVEYMAPEQAKDTSKATEVSDLYSLACILYRMLSGKIPFSGSHFDILVKHQTEKPDISFFLEHPELKHDRALHALLAKFLAKEPDQRGLMKDFLEMCIKRYDPALEVDDLMATDPVVSEVVLDASKDPRAENQGSVRVASTKRVHENVVANAQPYQVPEQKNYEVPSVDSHTTRYQREGDSDTEKLPDNNNKEQVSSPSSWKLPAAVGGLAATIVTTIGLLLQSAGKPSTEKNEQKDNLDGNLPRTTETRDGANVLKNDTQVKPPDEILRMKVLKSFDLLRDKDGAFGFEAMMEGGNGREPIMLRCPPNSGFHVWSGQGKERRWVGALHYVTIPDMNGKSFVVHHLLSAKGHLINVSNKGYFQLTPKEGDDASWEPAAFSVKKGNEKAPVFMEDAKDKPYLERTKNEKFRKMIDELHEFLTEKMLRGKSATITGSMMPNPLGAATSMRLEYELPFLLDHLTADLRNSRLFEDNPVLAEKSPGDFLYMLTQQVETMWKLNMQAAQRQPSLQGKSGK